jgi:hypothetical protein
MRLKLTWFLALMATLGAAYIVRVHATQAFGFAATTIAVGRFGDIDTSNLLVPVNNNPQVPGGPPGPRPPALWMSLQKTKGLSDVYVQSNVWQPVGVAHAPRAQPHHGDCRRGDHL